MKKRELLKDKILELHYKGMCNKDISKQLNISPSTVSVMITHYTKRTKTKEGYFNIDELECWLFPSSKY